MTTREEVEAFCLRQPGTYSDYPFHDENWELIRLKKTRKSFIFIYERGGQIWINVKCSPQWRDFWRDVFPAVRPAYHMNKEHWNTVILDGTVPEAEVRRMILESFDLVAGERPSKRKEGGK